VTTLPKASAAFTATLKAAPAVEEVGIEVTESCAADPAATETEPDPPTACTVSLAVMVWLPAVLNVTWTVVVPFVRVALAGSTACGSLLVNETVPAYLVNTLPLESSAVMVIEKAVPAVTDPETAIVRRLTDGEPPPPQAHSADDIPSKVTPSQRFLMIPPLLTGDVFGDPGPVLRV